MTTLAIVEPLTLIGKELRETLDRRHRRGGLEVRLLSDDKEAVGTLTEIGGAAALVAQAEPESLDGVDLAFFCGTLAATQRLLRPNPGLAAVLLCPDATAATAPPRVAGITGISGGTSARVVLSPQPSVVILAHLLHPLLPLGVEQVVATVLQPVSARQEAGLDEVLEQTKTMLTFQGNPPVTVFGRQLAFNLLPAGDVVADPVPQLRAVLETPGLELALHRVQGGMFHSYAVAAYVRFPAAVDAGAVREALARNPVVEPVDEPEILGPIDAAGRDEVLVGSVDADPHQPGAFWLWGVMDNLTRGGATNALALAEEIVGEL